MVKGLSSKQEDLSEVSPPELRSGKAGCSNICFNLSTGDEGTRWFLGVPQPVSLAYLASLKPTTDSVSKIKVDSV